MTKEQWLRQLRRPIIAAVHGMAYGDGCEIAVSTDFIIASDDAVCRQPERTESIRFCKMTFYGIGGCGEL
jgi:enoyl-CoA hydratase/carnithine racemase